MEMLGKVVFAVVGFSVFLGCCVYSGVQQLTMLARVNELRPFDQRLPRPDRWSWEEESELLREYKRLFPEGRLFLRAVVALAIGAASVLVTLLVLSSWARP